MLSVALATMLVSQMPAAVRRVEKPDTGENAHYVGNRAPLTPSYFRKLPVGSIKPEGWVRKQLELQADGFIGHLTEISPWLEKENNAWLSPTGEGKNAWEEVPYWLKGFGDTGYLLGDKRIVDEAKTWIEGVLSSRRPNGYFGPASNLVSNNGKPDVWPNMVMLNALQTYHEWSGDPRVIDLMTAYFKWQLDLPEEDLLLSYWEKHRGGDNIASVYWLYNRIGEPWLLDLVHKIHRRGADWVGGIPDGHGVNFAQAFREPAQYGVLSKDPAHTAATERNYQTFRKDWGQVPGGLYGADENVRKGFHDPRQAAETCAMVEMMLSHEMLLTLTGDSVWAERCEDVTFNSFPASMTPDLKALRYLTAPNMAVGDKASKSPGIQNGGPMFLYDPKDHRCCQHNVSHGWPYYAEHLWLATAGNGLGVALYAPSTVKAKVGEGTEVTITETTDYPFADTVKLTLSTPKTVRFPLTLRIPRWCEKPEMKVNGEAVAIPAGNGGYVVLERDWADKSTVELRFPMAVTTQTWEDHQGAVSVHRGPLTYSLAIGEKYTKEGDKDWPAWDLRSTTPWNYGLTLDAVSFRTTVRKLKPDVQPFSREHNPIEIETEGQRIPAWQLDMYGLVPPLQQSPASTTQPEEFIKLVPMGSARLRVTVFPRTTSEREDPYKPWGPKDWVAPPKPKPSLPASASHVYRGDTVNALTDGLVPRHSNDQLIPRFTWWDHKGSTEWVDVTLPQPKAISEARVYWFDDRGDGGGCRVPQSWRLLAEVDGKWQEVQTSGPYGVDLDRFNTVRFKPVKASTFRIEAKLQEGYSSGILEWQLK